MNDVIDMMSVIYKWIDQSASFEWIINPAKVSPKELYEYYLKAHREGIKNGLLCKKYESRKWRNVWVVVGREKPHH